MKLIIAGSRHLDIPQEMIDWCVRKLELEVIEVVCGKANGIDTIGEQWAKTTFVPVIKYFPADWNTHGKSAGPKRNKQMAEYADALLLIWDGESKGSRNMKEQMEKLGKPIYEYLIKRVV